LTSKQLRLFRYLLPYWQYLASLILVLALLIGLEVLGPWPTKLLVDHVLGQQPLPEALRQLLPYLPASQGLEGLLLWACISTIVIFLAGTLLSMASTYLSVELGHRTTYRLGGDLFLHLQQLPLLFHKQRAIGDIMARVTDDAFCVQMLLNGSLLPLLQSVCTLTAILIIMWRLEPAMTALSLSVVPFLSIVTVIFGQRLKVPCQERRHLEGCMASLVQQTLSAIPAVQAFTRERIEHARFRHCAHETVTAHRRAVMADTWFKLLVCLITSVGTAVMMWLGARYALNGEMTVGTVLVFLAYLGSLYRHLNSTVQTVSTWQYTAANMERVLEIFDTRADVQELPTLRDFRLQGQVCFENVTFGYEPQHPVLKDISFEVRPGEIVAIVGPTGTGKSTLVNMLVRFFDPWCGRVTLDGQDIRLLPINSLRQQVAIVFQEAYILPLTVADNIAYGRPDATREEIVAAAEAANADGFIRRLRQGYDTIVGEQGATLSGGEKQRLAIARAFLKDAPILILDEPTSALDSHAESLLLESLARLVKGRTTFIVAHRLSTIRNADRILVIDGGRIVEQGKHSELIALGGLYKNMYWQQMEIARHESLTNSVAETVLLSLTAAPRDAGIVTERSCS